MLRGTRYVHAAHVLRACEVAETGSKNVLRGTRYGYAAHVLRVYEWTYAANMNNMLRGTRYVHAAQGKDTCYVTSMVSTM